MISTIQQKVQYLKITVVELKRKFQGFANIFLRDGFEPATKDTTPA